jgi:hypothetical protein
LPDRLVVLGQPRVVHFVGTPSSDRMLIVNRRHLEQVLAEYVDHFNGRRPHRFLDRRTPDRTLISAGRMM